MFNVAEAENDVNRLGGIYFHALAVKNPRYYGQLVLQLDGCAFGAKFCVKNIVSSANQASWVLRRLGMPLT